MTEIICVNADGSTEKRSIAALLHRIADFERGKVWVQQMVASNGVTSIPVYTEIPWGVYSNLSPKAQKELEEEYARKCNAGGEAAGLHLR